MQRFWQRSPLRVWHDRRQCVSLSPDQDTPRDHAPQYGNRRSRPFQMLSCPICYPIHIAYILYLWRTLGINVFACKLRCDVPHQLSGRCATAFSRYCLSKFPRNLPAGVCIVIKGHLSANAVVFLLPCRNETQNSLGAKLTSLWPVRGNGQTVGDLHMSDHPACLTPVQHAVGGV